MEIKPIHPHILEEITEINGLLNAAAQAADYYSQKDAIWGQSASSAILLKNAQELNKKGKLFSGDFEAVYLLYGVIQLATNSSEQSVGDEYLMVLKRVYEALVECNSPLSTDLHIIIAMFGGR